MQLEEPEKLQEGPSVSEMIGKLEKFVSESC